MSAVVAPWAGVVYSPPKPNDLNTVEQAIVAQLAANMPIGVVVEAYPVQPDKYRMRGAAAVVLVRFAEDGFGRPLSTGQISQEDTQHWEITVLARNLGWKYGGEGDALTGSGLPLAGVGAYALLDIVRLAMIGFRLPGFKKTYALSRRFRDYNEGWWFYVTTFALPTMVVENYSTPATPLFVNGLMLEAGGITTIAVPTAALAFNSGNQISLGQTNVSAITVSNVSTGAVYSPASDYSVDTVTGVITRATGGTITPEQTVNVAFSYSEVVGAVAGGSDSPTFPTN